MKRRLLRFGFDVLKLRNFQIPVKNKSNVNAPWVLYISTHYASLPLAYSYAYGNIRHSLGVYTYRRGALTLFVSTGRAMRRPQNVERAIVQGFTLFLCLVKRVQICGIRSPCPHIFMGLCLLQNKIPHK
ncbi:MAG: hypothetical protein U0K83_03895 [Bacteroidales bacterium]|nr:hypothetical protein [Bacteroidales bacterium]